MAYWLGRLRIKIPLLVIPLMFIMFPRFQTKEVYGLYYLLVIWMSLMCVGTGINYWWQADTINELIKQGQPMPTPGNHIRFSVLLAYAIISGIYLYGKAYYWKYPWEKKLLPALLIFLFLFLHFLSVRTGLVVLYAVGLFMGLRYALQTRKYWIGATVMAMLVIMPVLAYYTVPSFRAKIEYMSYDRWMHEHEMGALYADSGRITSLKVGYQIFREHPVLGVGVGHIQQEVNRLFQTQYPDLPNPLMPHNQLLYVLATTGILGLLLFSIAFVYPFYYRKNYLHPMMMASFIVFSVLIMLEHNLENSGGIAFYTFSLCLLLNHLNKKGATA
jgi:O-antigen ligase